MTARNQPLAGAPLWAGYLTKNNVFSSKAATASIPRALAGQARMLWEHANGQLLVDPATSEKIPACAPKNPRGLLGEDHSGPPFGREFKHTYFVWSNPDPNDAPNLYTPPPKLERNAGAVTIIGFENDILVPVPAGVQGGRYEQATVRAAVYVETAAAASAAKLRLWPDIAASGSDVQNQDFLTTSTGYISITFTYPLDMVPGKINRVRVKLYSTSDAAIKVHLLALAFSQEG